MMGSSSMLPTVFEPPPSPDAVMAAELHRVTREAEDQIIESAAHAELQICTAEGQRSTSSFSRQSTNQEVSPLAFSAYLLRCTRCTR